MRLLFRGLKATAPSAKTSRTNRCVCFIEPMSSARDIRYNYRPRPVIEALFTPFQLNSRYGDKAQND
jgi:hypothetical protein